MNATDEARRSLSLVFERPKLIIAELAWRWAFAIGAIGIILMYSGPVRDALSLSAADRNQLFNSNLMTMIAVASEILAGAMPLLFRAFLGAAPKLALLWIICATLGRGPILREMVAVTGCTPAPNTRRYWMCLTAVHVIRVIVLLIVLSAWLAGSGASALVMGDPESPRIFLMFVLFMGIFAAGCVLWALVHFVVSQAALFVAGGESNPLEAIAKSLQLSFQRKSELGAAAAINAAWRTAAATIVTVLSLLLIPLGHLLPAALLGAVAMLLTVIYCAASDILLLARTVAYLRIALGAPEVAHQ